ncbi:MAG TPA: glycosyltransferase family 4 protein [Thermoanaerobaculia bacterium]
MRVLFVNRYFHPDHSATSQIASDLTMHLASRGWEVHAITSRQRYDDARARLAPHEVANGVTIHRAWSTRFGRAGLIGRAIDYATFYVSAFFAVLRYAGSSGSSVPRSSSANGPTAPRNPRNPEDPRGTVVVAMTDPPLLSIVCALAAMLRGARLVNWLQDLFPEVAESLGMRGLGVLRGPRNWSLRRARVNVVLGERMRERVGNDARVIHNWADAGLHPLPFAARFSVGYSGNLGRAHDAETIVEAMRLAPEIPFVFTGGGAQLERVRRSAGANVEFRPYAPREQLSESLSSADVHLVSLQPAMEGLIVPSKFYGILAVARPVVFIGARDGEVARLVEEARCGYVIEPGDAAGLARVLRELASDRAKVREMGERGRTMYEQRFAPRHAFARWEEVLTC